MAARTVKVVYQDGREETVKVYPRAQVMAEEHFGGVKNENAISVTYYFGWAALNISGKETLDYETWLNKIEDVEDVTWIDDAEKAANEPGPTRPDPSGDTSSDSASGSDSSAT
jgi:hypothetical protein